MSYYDEYSKGHLVLPTALFEYFGQLFPSADDFVVWLYFFENQDSVPSEIAKKLGKSLAEVNHSITALQKFGALKVTLVGIGSETDTLFDTRPVFAHLDELTGEIAAPSAGPVEQNDGQLQDLVQTFEGEMGVISPMQAEELRALLFEDKYELALIKQALREAVLNRKVSLNYVKAILRNWRNDGISNAQAAQNRKAERENSQQQNSQSPQDFYIPLDGPWNNKS